MTWPKALLGEVADFRLGKMLDRRKNRGSLRPYLANVNVRWGRFDLENLREMRFEDHEIEKYGLAYGDIVMCEGGEPGRCALWKVQRPGMMIQKALHRIRAVDGVSNEFLFYSLFHRGRAGLLAPLFTGATIRHLPREKLAKVEIDVPPVPTQRRIASTLSAYDDLIENNRRRIHLLERAARLLYREWFVRLRFPGHDRIAIADGLPEGWGTHEIGDICDIVGGGTPSTKVSDYWNGRVTWIVPSDVTKNDSLVLLDSARKITERGLNNSSAKLVPPNTILMTSRASVGYFALAPSEVCTNQGFINIIPHCKHSRMYLLFNLMSRVDEIRNNAKGTTYTEISKGRFRQMEVVFPPKTLLGRFADVVGSNVLQISCLTQSNRLLTHARNLLLPRLMNGEITV